MTEPQRVTIYSAAYDRSPGASHRLLRQAAQLYAPGLAEPALASGAHGKPYFPDAYAHTCLIVGADAYIGPLGSCEFAEDFRKTRCNLPGRCVPASGRPTSVTLLRRERL